MSTGRWQEGVGGSGAVAHTIGPTLAVVIPPGWRQTAWGPVLPTGKHNGAKVGKTMGVVERGPGWELRLGRWQDVLSGVECDAVITDPPFGERTHKGQRHGRRDARYTNYGDPTALTATGFGYEPMKPQEARELVASAAVQSSTWTVIFTSHDLWPEYAGALEGSGRYVFAPLASVIPGRNVRLGGDGPASWADWLVISRLKGIKWRALPGAYVTKYGNGRHKRDLPFGSKPELLMRKLIRDYSLPGDLIVDPYAGGATTLLAAVIEGRKAIGAERDPDTFAKAVKRLRRGWTPELFPE